MVGKAGWEFTPVVGAEKAEREFAIAVAGLELTPTAENMGEDVTMQVVLNTWGARKYEGDDGEYRDDHD